MSAAPDLAAALDAAGIALKRLTPGNHRARCPGCGRGPRDDTVAVTIHHAGDAVWWCHRLCGFTGGWRERDPAPSRPAAAARPRPAAAAAVQPATLRPQGREFWSACQPITAESPAGRYLTTRGCAAAANDLRWHAAVWNAAEHRTFAAMVALITDVVTVEPISLHITYLRPDGSGKAEIARPRVYLRGHRKAGGVVRLHADDEVTQGIILGEGIETCLTAALEFAPVWACLDAGNLGSFPVLPGISGLTVLVDNDAAGWRALAELRGRYEAAGIEVIAVASPRAGEDLNDLARGAA